MKNLKLVFALFLANLSNSIYAQSFRLTETKPYRGLEVFLMPGISPGGEKLFQFSFLKFKKLNDSIRVDSLILSASSGKQLTLSAPQKLISGKLAEKGKQWYSSFSLNEAETDFVKNETVSEVDVQINNRYVRIIFPDSSRIKLHELLSNCF